MSYVCGVSATAAQGAVCARFAGTFQFFSVSDMVQQFIVNPYFFQAFFDKVAQFNWSWNARK